MHNIVFLQIRRHIVTWFIIIMPIGVMYLLLYLYFKPYSPELSILNYLTFPISIIIYYRLTGKPLVNSLGTKFNLINCIRYILFGFLTAAIIFFTIKYLKGNWNVIWLWNHNRPLNLIFNQLCMVALIEEWYFRGFAYDVFNDLSQWKVEMYGVTINYAIICSAIAFTMIHIRSTQMLPVFFPGILFGIMRERTDNIAAPVILHAACNLLVKQFGAV